MAADAKTERVETVTLGASVRRGVGWKLFSLAASQAIRLVTVLVIARALTPHEFGLAAMAVSVWAVATVFTDLALGAALVQRVDIDDEDRSTAFWAGATAGTILALAGVAASGSVARFFGEPDVQPLFAALGAGVFLGALASTHVALLTRAMAFRALELVAVIATFSGALIGIGLAIAGAGAWAIVANAVAVAAVTSGLVWLISPWRPQLMCSRRSLRRLSGFASLLTLTRAVAAVQRSADRLLIGRLLGAPALGAYAVPASIVAVPAARLVDPVRSVLFPAFSRLQRSRSELGVAWVRVTRLVVALLSPLLVLLAATADEIVELALTARWSEAVPVLRILALGALPQLAGAMNAVVLTALGRLGIVLQVFGVTAVLSAVGLLIGRENGLVGAAAGYAAATVLVAPVYIAVTARALGLTRGQVAGAYAPTGAGLLALAAGAAIVDLAVAGAHPAVRLATTVAVGLCAYTLVALRSSRGLREDIAVLVSRQRP